MSNFEPDYEALRDPSKGAPSGDEWTPESAAESLAMERTFHPSETPEQMAERIFRENLIGAASAIVHTAIHATNDRTRLDAAKYVVERNLGKIGDTQEGVEDPLMQLIKEMSE
jgi:hypothetical protein